jgi:hypothetical protein
VLTEDGVPQRAGSAGADPDELLLADAGQRPRVERRRSIRDLESDPRPRHGTSGQPPQAAIQRPPDELLGQVAHRTLGPLKLLMGNEVAVRALVPAVDAPQLKVVGQLLVGLRVDPEDLAAAGTLATEEAVLVHGHADPHPNHIAVAAAELNAIRPLESALVHRHRR